MLLPLLKRIVSQSNNIEIAFMETSAKDSINVQIAFERVLNEIYKITAKNAVKEPKSGVTGLDKGKKIDAGDEEDEGPVEPRKGDRLDPKKLNKKRKQGCC